MTVVVFTEERPPASTAVTVRLYWLLFPLSERSTDSATVIIPSELIAKFCAEFPLVII